MAFSAPIDRFRLGDEFSSAFYGKRVLITGSGRDGGIRQALSLAVDLNGAEVVGIHFHRSCRDGFDLVDRLKTKGIRAFALQADVTNIGDLWASRSYVIEQMGGTLSRPRHLQLRAHRERLPLWARPA